MKKQLSFIVIIANYNGEKFLKNCLESIQKTNYDNFKVCIVDDGSTDKSLEVLNSFQRDINLEIINQNHGGASKARNNAIKKFKDKYDVLVFLDNDTEVDSNWLDALNQNFINSVEIDALQCLLIDFEKREKIQSNGVYLIPHVCWGVSRQAGENVSDLDLKSEPCAAISAALAIRSYVIKEVGYFDERLAVSTEDLDYTWRIWIYGFSIFNCAKAKVYHYSKSISQRKEMNVNLSSQYFHITKNSFRTLVKNYSLGYLFWYLPQSIFINLIRAGLVLLRRGDLSALTAFFKAISWNIVNLKDTLKNRSTIQKKRKNSDKRIYNTLMVKESLLDIYEKHFKQTKLL
jgi:GT2 family glycosyltransferase